VTAAEKQTKQTLKDRVSQIVDARASELEELARQIFAQPELRGADKFGFKKNVVGTFGADKFSFKKNVVGCGVALPFGARVVVLRKQSGLVRVDGRVTSEPSVFLAAEAAAPMRFRQ
jgi:hypothetical protein